MRKINLLALAVLATVLLSSAFLSMATAQDIGNIEPAYPSDPSAMPPVDLGAANNADENQFGPSDSNATNPDAPVTSDDPILYTTQDNETGLIAPGAEDANLVSAQSTPDYILPIIGIVLAVAVGGAIGVVYFRKQGTAGKN